MSKIEAAKELLAFTQNFKSNYGITWAVTELAGLIKRLDSSRETVRDVNNTLIRNTPRVEIVKKKNFRVVDVVSKKNSVKVQAAAVKPVAIRKEINEPADILRYSNEEIKEILGKDLKNFAKGMGSKVSFRDLDKFIDAWRVEIANEQKDIVEGEGIINDDEEGFVTEDENI